MTIILGIVLGVLIQKYVKSVLGYKETIDTKYKEIRIFIIVVVISAIYGAFSEYILQNSVITYLVLFAFLALCLEFIFSGTLIEHVFLSSQFTFHMLLSKGISISIIAIVDNTNIYNVTIMQYQKMGVMLTVVALTLLIFSGFCYIFSPKHTAILIENRSKLRLLTVAQLILNILLCLNSLSYNYDIDHRWFSIYHLTIYLMLGVVFYTVFIYFVNENKMTEYKIGYDIYQIQLKKQIESFNTQTEYIKSMRKFKHDYVMIKKLLQKMIYNSDVSQIQNIVREMDETIDDITMSHKDFSNNALVQAILAHTYTLIKNNGGTLDGEIVLPQNISVSELELCRVITNVMDNALEATKVLGNKGYIKVNTYLKNNWHITICENNFKGEIITENEQIATKKKDKNLHGYGLSNIKEIVESKKGFVKIEVGEILGGGENTFKIKIYLPNVEQNIK